MPASTDLRTLPEQLLSRPNNTPKAQESRYRVTEANRRGVEARSRLDRLLSTARRLFIERGYLGTSLNDVIADAGGSKATLLKYFGNKAGLFSAVVADVSSRLVRASHLADLKGEPDKVLQTFGERVLQFYLDRESLVAYRGVITGGVHDRTMALAFYRQGHLTVVAALSAQLTQWQRAGLMACRDCRDDADLFLHLIRAGPYEQRLLAIRDAPTRREISNRVRRAVQIFLRGVANEGTAGPSAA